MWFCASAMADGCAAGGGLHCGWFAQVVRVLELGESEASSRVSGGGCGVAGGAVSRVLGLGDRDGPRTSSQSCSKVFGGPNFVGVGDSGSLPLSQWYGLEMWRSPALFRSIASVKESADWSPGSGEDGFDAGLGGGLGGGVLRDALGGAALGSGLAACCTARGGYGSGW